MIPVSEPFINEADIKAVVTAMRGGWLSGDGPIVEEFEHDFADKVGVQHAIAVSNGSAALDAAFASIDLQPGDEVIMPAFTIISCAQQVVRMGAIPVLIDSNDDDWNMCTERVSDAVTSRTRAVLAVHTYGLAVDMGSLFDAVSGSKIRVIEDAAEAHGLQYRGRPCGSMGDIGTFSFYSNKTMTTGEGGMAVTDSVSLATKLRKLRNLAFQSERRFVHEELGWNLRMSSMQAALGRSQLARLDDLVARKREIGALYRDRLVGIPDVQIAPSVSRGALNSYWIVGLVLGESHPVAEIVRSRLASQGVGSRPFFCPMHLQPVFRKMGLFTEDRHPVSERLWSRGLYLPSGLSITADQIDQVCDSLERVLL